MNNFDKNIKKKLYNSEMPVSDGLWASIESQIPVKKEQPKYWILFLLLACAVSLTIFTTTTEDNNTSATAEVEKQQELSQGNLSNESLVSGNLSSGRSSQLSNHHNSTEDLADSINDNKETKKNRTTSSNHTITQDIQEKSLTITSDLSQSTFDLSLDKPNRESSNFLSAVSSTKKLKFVNNPFKSFNSKASNKSVFKLIEKSRIYKSAEPLTKLKELDENFYDKGISCNNTIDLAIYGNTLEKYSVAACPSFEPYRTGLYVFADQSLGYNFQRLEALDPEFKDLEDLRNSKENGSISFSTNLGVGKQWSSGFLLETGLNYDKITVNSRKYSDDAPSRLMITIDSVLTPQGWEITRDSTFIAQANDGQVTNRFSQVNIPVIFGYESFVSERFSLIAKAGVLVNISSKNEGQISNASGDLVTYDSDNINTSLFKTNMGISYMASLHIQTEFTPLLAGYTGINVNYYPDNFALRSNPIKQTYTKVGLTAGLKYRL